MTEYATTNGITNVFQEEDNDSDLVVQLDKNATVAVIQHGCFWSKIIKDSYEGFCKTANLIFENGSAKDGSKESTIMISIPRDCACALYNALKFSLKI